MRMVTASQYCALHLWERGLERFRNVECVVRTCRYCGRRELCWSREPLAAETVEDADRIHRRTDRVGADTW
jgi:hypothetical protein